uniref:Uncharacterized protein n=1 Tax=viral metagenome TaxID=1070528 RepID=A0A6M3JZ73_9ZZZZ
MFKMNQKIAYAIGWDAGNRSMKKAGRTSWNDTDKEAAITAMNQAYPEKQYLADQLAKYEASKTQE